MKSSFVFSLLVLIVACLTSLCHGQIHYTPDWGHGKRSLASQFVDSGSDSMAPCLEQTELNLLLEVAKILTAEEDIKPNEKYISKLHNITNTNKTREAKKLSNCLKDCPSLE